MNVFHQTDIFSDWLKNLKDIKARARIVIRIRSAEHGNFGDCTPAGEGISEMRLLWAWVSPILLATR
jgi:putative addiction module killer protein